MLALAIWFVTLVTILDTYFKVQESHKKEA